MTIRPRPSAITVTLLSIGAGLALGGCQKPPLKPLNPCLVSGVSANVSVTNIDKVDLLFLVDNSGSMKEEQTALRSQFPKLITVLTTGDRDGDGTMDFPPAKDLHLGVVSSDMGLVGVMNAQALNCPGFGDDGLLLHMPRDPNVQGCATSYPTFLTYLAPGDDPVETANDFGCIAALGTTGCGFEQQLESVLKAVWPAGSAAMPAPPPMGGPFLSDATGAGAYGHGDNENAGFIRNDPMQGLSLIAFVVVSDEEDCSSSDTEHFTPTADLPANSPVRSTMYFEHPNLRCYENKQNLWPVERYISGYKALRPGQENLVIFAGIVGVPPELVEPADLEAVDFSNPVQRDAFYNTILSAPAMTETVDPNSLMTTGGGNLRPSCQTATGTAYPPRRIVEVAKGFGENGVIQSICQADFGPALDAIIDVIARQLGAVCLPRTLVRNSEGLVGCNVVWELPLAKDARAGVPIRCGDPGYEFLLSPEDGRKTNDRGGAICVVPQLAVRGLGATKTVEPTMTNGVQNTKGWYYDDFSPEVLAQCTGQSKQRVAFSKDAPPPSGVTVSLECLNEAQTLTNTRTDIRPNVEQPTVGKPCVDVMLRGKIVSGDEACVIQTDTDFDRTSMFCHPELNVCVLSCETDADCPAAWVCDTREATVKRALRNLCVNPTCGDLK